MFRMKYLLTGILLMLCALSTMAEQRSPFESIDQDIKTLFGHGKEVSEAALRLIDRGDIILDQVHRSLLSAETNVDQKRILILILSNISNEKSVHPIIHIAKSFPDDIQLNRGVISALGKFKQNDEIVSFVSSVLDSNGGDPKVVVTALDYFAEHPYKAAVQWAEKYSGPGLDKDVRARALYLGGILGIKSFKERIVDALGQNDSAINKDFILIGLVCLTKPDEFNSLIKDLRLQDSSIKTARLYYYLNKGSQKERKAAAMDIINIGHRFLIKFAIDYLIKANDAEALAPYWLRNNKSVRFAVNRAGLIIVTDEKGSRFEKKTAVNKTADYYDSTKTEMPSIKEFVESIFLTFKNHDRDAFESLALLNNDELARYVVMVSPPNKAGDSEIRKYREQLIKQRSITLSSWDKVYQRGVELNLYWPEVNYIATTYKDAGYTSNPAFIVGYLGHYYKIQLPDNNRIPFEGKWKITGVLWLDANKPDSRAMSYWADLAESNNNSVAARELRLLSKGKAGKIDILRMLSSYEDPEAQYQLYSQLNVSSKLSDKSEAIEWLSRSAANNYARSQYELGEYYREKYYANHPGDLSTIDSDLIESKRQLELAVSQKYVPALKLISNNYASGQGGYTIDYDNAIKYLKIASALNPDKLSDLERQYYLTTDFQKRIGELTKIKNGLASSDQETLLRESIKLLEHGTKEDKQNALKMLESAASAGYVDAQYQLGKLYATGNSAIPKDIDTAISWWEKAASQKNIASMEELAYGYTDGKYSIAIDLDMAVNLSEELFKYYASIPNEPGSSDSVRAWRVNMCNAINSIKRNRGDSYTIPKDKVRHCMRF